MKQISVLFTVAFICAEVLMTSKCRENVKDEPEYDRPILGVFTQETFSQEYGDAYLSANYVKYVEEAGGRVVAIRLNEDEMYYKELFQRINGMLLPGGSVGLSSYYGKAAKIMYNLAIQANKAGDYFPVWGSCLGFELLTSFAAGQNLLADCDAENLQLPLVLTPDYNKSRLFQNMPSEVLKIVTTLNVTANYHYWCLTPKNYTSSKQLSSFFRVLTLNQDKKGTIFISTVEAKKYPIYGVQWHPEKNSYQWALTDDINHSSKAVYAMQYFANFLVNEARRSKHRFPSEAAASDALINNYRTIFFKAPSFREEYFFNFTKKN